MGYGLIRSLIEPIRIDPLIFMIPKIGKFPELDLKVSLVSAILLFIAGAVIYIQRKKIYIKYHNVAEIKYK
jgi:prolipoprotein diacylglyceryltransferase